MSFRNDGQRETASKSEESGDRSRPASSKSRTSKQDGSAPKDRPAKSKAKAKGKTQKSKSSKKGKSAKRKSGLARLDDGLVFVLSHPLRVRMLASLKIEGDASAKELCERLNCSKYNTSYHMRVLRKYDCVELVRTEKVRSVEKRIYRAKIAVEFPTEIWDALPPAVQGMVVAAVFMTSYSDTEIALISRAYEDRPESHASWSNPVVDIPGWLALLKLVDGVLPAAKRIEEEAKDRIEAAGGDISVLTVSLNMSAFVLPDDAAAIEERLPVRKVAKRIKGKQSLRHDRKK